MPPDYDLAGPGAAELLESLRAFGYDLPTAAADIVDNSITAGARNVWIDLVWAGAASRILIRDDGHGLSDDELRQAMRPGSLNPPEGRAAHDLGRFGLGMKTASISQCRCLTVLSKRKSETATVRCWDLDYIASTGTGEWRLLKGDDILAESDRAELDGQEHGTILFWDRLDRLVGGAGIDDLVAQRHFREQADALRDHLSMVFHRFLQGRSATRIHINGRAIEPWDPFLENSEAVAPLPSETLIVGGERAEIKAFILPHRRPAGGAGRRPSRNGITPIQHPLGNYTSGKPGAAHPAMRTSGSRGAFRDMGRDMGRKMWRRPKSVRRCGAS